MILRFCNFIKSKILDNTNYVTNSFTNYRSVKYTIGGITTANPFGIGGMPNEEGMVSYLMDVEGVSIAPVCLGYSQSIPPTSYNPQPGDVWYSSSNFVIYLTSAGLIAYRIQQPTVSELPCSIPNGDWVAKILKDVLADLQTIKSDYNTHYHVGSPSTAIPTTVLPTFRTEGADTTAVSTPPKILINNDGTNPNG